MIALYGPCHVVALRTVPDQPDMRFLAVGREFDQAAGNGFGRLGRVQQAAQTIHGGEPQLLSPILDPCGERAAARPVVAFQNVATIQCHGGGIKSCQTAFQAFPPQVYRAMPPVRECLVTASAPRTFDGSEGVRA
jgi:hypothetical protein